MTSQEEREWVEARWERIETDLDPLYANYVKLHNGLWPDVISQWDTFRAEDQEAAWHAAYLFTLDRERQIAEVEEEISLINGWRWIHEDNAAGKRILAAEQRRLDALRTGWKGGN
jgi:hypothetical protein